jgi:hypothetical protein
LRLNRPRPNPKWEKYVITEEVRMSLPVEIHLLIISYCENKSSSNLIIKLDIASRL